MANGTMHYSIYYYDKRKDYSAFIMQYYDWMEDDAIIDYKHHFNSAIEASSWAIRRLGWQYNDCSTDNYEENILGSDS